MEGFIERWRARANEIALEVSRLRRRDVVGKIREAVLSEKTTVIYGLRGIGKTTALLQVYGDIREERPFYVSGDVLAVERVDPLSLAEELEKRGYRILMLDEAHMIDGWERYAKIIHDMYSIHAVYTGSATLAYASTPDLARRAYKIHAFPLTLREHARLFHGKEMPGKEEVRRAVFEGDVDAIAEIYESVPRDVFREYLLDGGFAFFGVRGYRDRVNDLLERALLRDVHGFKNVSVGTIEAARRVLMYMAGERPAEITIEAIARLVGGKEKAYTVLTILKLAEIIDTLEPEKGGWKKSRKVYFTAQALYTALRAAQSLEPEVGVLRETLVYNTLRMFAEETGARISYPVGGRRQPDFVLRRGKEHTVIEVGGRTKGGAQVGRGIVVGEGMEPRKRGDVLYVPLEVFALIV